MNGEVISSRYAKALLAFVTETEYGDKVYSQVCDILVHMKEVPLMKEYILQHDDIAIDRKVALLNASLEVPMADELEKFVRFVNQKRRMELLDMILWAFVARYREAQNIKYGSLVTSRPDDRLKESLEQMFGDKLNSEVHLQSSVESEIIGGFVLELDGYRVDASVRTKLEKISKELIDTSNRIV